MVEKKFKRTEIGLIPEGWEIKKMSEIISEISMGPFGSDIKVSNFVNKGVPVLNGYNISAIRLKERYSNFVTVEKAKSLNKAIAKRGDIIVTHRGTIGQIAYIPEDSIFEKYVISQSQFRFSVNKTIALYRYVVLFFHSDNGKNIIFGSKAYTGVPAIAQATTTFKKFQIPLPTLPEQQVIVETLTNTDEWIESLEKLIEKKRLVKQGIIQKLLMPQKHWKTKKLGDCLDYIQPTPFLVKSTKYNPNNIIPVLTAGKTFILGFTDEEFGIFKKVPTIIFDDFTTASKYVDFEFKAKSSAMKMLVQKNSNCNLKFLFELLQNLKYQIGDHKRHWIGEFQNIEIKVPIIAEQNRIANLLSDMDSEIKALEQKLTKANQIKQGMMQQLLTGRIRLIDSSIRENENNLKRTIINK